MKLNIKVWQDIPSHKLFTDLEREIASSSFTLYSSIPIRIEPELVFLNVLIKSTGTGFFVVIMF